MDAERLVPAALRVTGARLKRGLLVAIESPHWRASLEVWPGGTRCGFSPTAVGGSIPARAGEPRSASGKRARIGVYPRAGGGTARCMAMASASWGLSPRLRGNRTESPLSLSAI